MKERLWRIAIDVPKHIRTILLRSYPPRFELVHDHSINWAVGVSDRFQFDSAPHVVHLYGLHSSLSTQAFAVRVGPYFTNDNREKLFLVHSVRPGVIPAHAGLMDDNAIVPIRPGITFEASFQRVPLKERDPVRADTSA